MEQIHAGHRQRLREQYKKSGVQAMPDHLLLELLLSYAIPRRDVNPLAHKLLDAFGSLTNVLSATDAELHAVDGIGEQAITLLRLVFDLHSRMELEPMLTVKSGNYLKNVEQVGRYALSIGARDRYETLRLLCFDSTLRLLHCSPLSVGTKNSVRVDLRRIIESALFYRATSIILVHNHPSGRVTPSAEDVDVYRHVGELASQLDLKLNDSIIVGDRCIYSFARDTVFAFPNASDTRQYTLSEYLALLSKADPLAENDLARAPYSSRR